MRGYDFQVAVPILSPLHHHAHTMETHAYAVYMYGGGGDN